MFYNHLLVSNQSPFNSTALPYKRWRLTTDLPQEIVESKWKSNRLPDTQVDRKTFFPGMSASALRRRLEKGGPSRGNTSSHGHLADAEHVNRDPNPNLKRSQETEKQEAYQNVLLTYVPWNYSTVT